MNAMNTWEFRFENKVGAIERQLQMDILAARAEMFPFGSESAHRRYASILRRDSLMKMVQDQVRVNPFLKYQ